MIPLSLALFAACPDHVAEKRGSDSGSADTGSQAADSDGGDTDTGVHPAEVDDCRAGIDRDGDGYAYCDQEDADFEIDLYYRDAMDIAGDYDGDGRADLLFAGPNDTYDGIQAVVIPGSAMAAEGTLDGASVSVVIRSTQEDYYPSFGLASAIWAGDTDGDGRADALVCDSKASGGSAGYGGTCWLLTSSELMTGVLDLDVIEPALANPNSEQVGGSLLQRMGDIDGDGRSDVALVLGSVSDTTAPVEGTWSGTQVSLILGSSLVNRTGSITPEQSDGRVTIDVSPTLYSVRGVPDLNGDGMAALVMTPSDNVVCDVLCFSADEILSGGVLTEDAGTLLFDTAGVDASYCWAVIAGDLDGDGRPNIVVDTRDMIQPSGSAYVLPTPTEENGRVNLDSVAEISASEAPSSEYALAGPGDLNGNGTNDLLVGYYHPLDDSWHAQDTHLAFLDGSLLVPGSVLDVYAIPTGWLESDMFTDGSAGDRVAVGGDIDGDGRDDLVYGKLNVFGMFAW